MPYKIEQLGGSVGVAGIRLPTRGHFPRMNVAPNLSYLHYSQEEAFFQLVFLKIYTINEPQSRLITTVHLTR